MKLLLPFTVIFLFLLFETYLCESKEGHEREKRATIPKAKVFLLLANSKFVGEKLLGGPAAAYGAYHGFLECTNIVCRPVGLTRDIAEVIKFIEFIISKIVDVLRGFTTFLISFGNVPFVKLVTTPLRLFLDNLIVPPLTKVQQFIKTTIDPTLTEYLKATGLIGASCNGIGLFAMLSNTVATVSDDVLDTNFLAETEIAADDAEGLCNSTILSTNFPKNAAWFQLLVDAKNTKKLLTGKPGSRRKRNAPGSSTTLATDASSETIGLKNILQLLDPVKDELDKLNGPVLDTLQDVKEVMDEVLNEELCIPLGPFGEALGAIYNLAQESIDNIMGAATSVANGALEDAAALLKEEFDEVGEVFEDVVEAAGRTLDDILEGVADVAGVIADVPSKIVDEVPKIGDAIVGEVSDVGDDLADVGEEIGDGIVDTANDVGEGVADTVDTIDEGIDDVGDAIGGVLDSWGKRRRKRAIVVDDDRQLRALLHARKRSKRDEPSLSADDVTSLGDRFVKGSDICISLNDVIATAKFLLDTILIPFKAVVNEMLGPLIDEVKKILQDFIPNVDFLDDLLTLLDSIKPDVDIPNFADFSSYVDLVVKNDFVSSAVSAGKELVDPECISAMVGFTSLDNTGSLEEVNCACFGECSGISKRSVADTESQLIPHIDCRMRFDGNDYRGTMSVSASGKTCLPWTAFKDEHLDIDFPEWSMKEASNYCRNPGKQMRIPFCHVGGKQLLKMPWPLPDITVPGTEVCKVTQCSIGCRATIEGSEYTGNKAVTHTGKVCQRWAVTHPHPHNFTGDDFPNDGNSIVLSENFCRNPNNHPGGPWCFTTDSFLKYDFCDIPLCYQDGMEHVMAQFRIHDWEWEADLTDPTSQLFQSRAKEITDQIKELNLGYELGRSVECVVRSFSPGSVKVRFTFSFYRTEGDTDVSIKQIKKDLVHRIRKALKEKSKFMPFRGTKPEPDNRCLDCMLQALESDDNSTCGVEHFFIGDRKCGSGCLRIRGECRCGPYQITHGMFRQCHNIAKLPFPNDFRKCAWNNHCARKCSKAYLAKHIKKCSGKTSKKVKCKDHAKVMYGHKSHDVCHWKNKFKSFAKVVDECYRIEES